MKKVLIIGLIVALALILVGGAGVVYARVRGIENRAVIALNTVQDKATVLRQFGTSQGIIINGDGPLLVGPQGEFGLRLGSGSMMQGFGPGGMMGGYGDGSCPRGNGYGLRGKTQGYGPGGMMGGRGCGIVRGQGLLHDYMITAFAEAIDLSVEEVETRLAEGEALKEIAVAQGFTQDELKDLVTQVRQAALDAAIADEVITQEQADLMLEHMEKYMGAGFGPGFKGGIVDCPMWDGDEAP